jgi:tetratricopeptide (TPR) repeat protein
MNARPVPSALLAAVLTAALAGGVRNASAQSPAPSTGAPQSVTVTGQKKASPWFKAESAHFIVYSNTGNDDVQQLLTNMERLDYVLRIYTKDFQSARMAPQKMTLYYHDRAEGFDAAVADEPEEAVGLYTSCGAGVQGYGVHLERIASLGDGQLARTPLNHSLSAAFEAYARHFLYRYTDIRSPSSYIDGFAQYFSTVRFSDRRMSIGRVPPTVSRYIYFIDNGHSFRLRYEDVFAAPASTGDAAGGEAPVRLEFLARSWVLMHYMLSSEENMAKRDAYLNQVHQDVPAQKAFSDAFGIKPGDIDSTLWRYRLKGIAVSQVEMPSLPVAQVSFTSLPEAGTDFLMAEATLRSCPSRKTGEALLRAAAQHPGGVPNIESARLTLSRAQIDWGRAEDALPHLTQAVRKDGASFDAVYLLGLAELRLAEPGAGPANGADSTAHLQTATELLARARTLNPKSAEAAYAWHQAQLRASDKPTQAALEAAIAAWQNGHEVNAYARSAALAYAWLGRGPEADNALAVLAHNDRDPQMAAWAKSWQKRLGASVTRAELLAEMRRDRSMQDPFREWTVAGENLMQTVEYNAGIEDSRKYLDSMRLADPMSEKNIFVAPSKR